MYYKWSTQESSSWSSSMSQALWIVFWISYILLRFETRANRSIIEAKFHTFWPFVKLMNGRQNAWVEFTSFASSQTERHSAVWKTKVWIWKHITETKNALWGTWYLITLLLHIFHCACTKRHISTSHLKSDVTVMYLNPFPVIRKNFRITKSYITHFSLRMHDTVIFLLLV